jgi:glyoxylate/hydroxypyruvate reductase A
MEIIFYHPTFDTQYWIRELEKQLPGARVREWKAGDNQPADYALVWHPPVEMLQGRALKAVFALGAGVDSILSKLRDHPDMLPCRSRCFVSKIPVWDGRCRSMP